jgi:hypothetical protein
MSKLPLAGDDEVYYTTRAMDIDEEIVYWWSTHCLFECDACCESWVCDHHWQTIWMDQD